MIITPASLVALRTGFRADFQGAFDVAESIYDKVATTVPSTTASNTYGWLGQSTQMREWVGDRVISDMAAHAYAISNKDWELTVGVKRTDIEDDNIGVYKPLMQEIGRAAKIHADEMVFNLLKAGETSLCYDGQNFFDIDHPVAANVDGTGAVTTVANMAVGAGPAWYLLDTSRSVRPLIYQERKPTAFTYMAAETDEEVFMRKLFRFGVDGRSNVGFGLWQTAYKSTMPLTAANFSAAYAAMQSIKADGGRPLAIRPTVLVVPPNLREQALIVTKAEYLQGGGTNVNAGLVDTIVTPWVL